MAKQEAGTATNNYFKATEHYFKGTEHYFKATEHYFKAFEIVLWWRDAIFRCVLKMRKKRNLRCCYKINLYLCKSKAKRQ